MTPQAVSMFPHYYKQRAATTPNLLSFWVTRGAGRLEGRGLSFTAGSATAQSSYTGESQTACQGRLKPGDHRLHLPSQTSTASGNLWTSK